jgi:hypothetical protein
MFVKDVTIDETVQQRNVNDHIHIRCAADGNHLIETLRRVGLFKDGEYYKAGVDYDYVYQVQRRLNDILNDQVTLPAELGGITLTVAQVAMALEMFTDVYAEEDDPSSSSSSSSA